MRTKHEVGIHQVPVQEHLNTRAHQCHLDIREHKDPNTTIKVDYEVSTDHGQTWEYGGGFTVVGSTETHDKNGDLIRYTMCNFGHEPTPKHIDHNGDEKGSDPAPHRLVRGTIEVTGNPVNTYHHMVGSPSITLDKSLVPTD